MQLKVFWLVQAKADEMNSAEMVIKNVTEADGDFIFQDVLRWIVFWALFLGKKMTRRVSATAVDGFLPNDSDC